ncbi:hypothetical protein SAMN02910356_02626 [Selenomonas sp. GACV-9]|nr:hypothetical protein SAMN02910356_02626 [Selenomonas ruminantium]
MCDAGGAPARPARCPLTTWTAARPSTKGRTPEPVTRGRTDRSKLLMGSGKRAGSGVSLRRGRCSQRWSKIDRSVSVHQSRNTAGRASPYGSLHRGIPYYGAPTLPALQTPQERLAATLPCAAGSVCMLLLLAAASQQPRGQYILSRPSYCAGAPRPLRSRRAVLLGTACWECPRRASVLGQPPSVGRILTGQLDASSSWHEWECVPSDGSSSPADSVAAHARHPVLDSFR